MYLSIKDPTTALVSFAFSKIAEAIVFRYTSNGPYTRAAANIGMHSLVSALRTRNVDITESDDKTLEQMLKRSEVLDEGAMGHMCAYVEAIAKIPGMGLDKVADGLLYTSDGVATFAMPVAKYFYNKIPTNLVSAIPDPGPVWETDAYKGLIVPVIYAHKIISTLQRDIYTYADSWSDYIEQNILDNLGSDSEFNKCRIAILAGQVASRLNDNVRRMEDDGKPQDEIDIAKKLLEVKKVKARELFEDSMLGKSIKEYDEATLTAKLHGHNLKISNRETKLTPEEIIAANDEHIKLEQSIQDALEKLNVLHRNSVVMNIVDSARFVTGDTDSAKYFNSQNVAEITIKKLYPSLEEVDGVVILNPEQESTYFMLVETGKSILDGNNVGATEMCIYFESLVDLSLDLSSDPVDIYGLVTMISLKGATKIEQELLLIKNLTLSKHLISKFSDDPKNKDRLSGLAKIESDNFGENGF